MKIYVFSFRGYHLGGTAVVLALTEQDARAVIAKRMEGLSRLKGQTVQLDEVIDPTLTAEGAMSQVIYYDDGDY